MDPKIRFRAAFFRLKDPKTGRRSRCFNLCNNKFIWINIHKHGENLSQPRTNRILFFPFYCLKRINCSLCVCFFLLLCFHWIRKISTNLWKVTTSDMPMILSTYKPKIPIERETSIRVFVSVCVFYTFLLPQIGCCTSLILVWMNAKKKSKET